MTPEINRTARDWLLVEEWANKRLVDYRTTLESLAIDDRTTLVLRGRIAELKSLIALGQPPRAMLLSGEA